MAMKVGSDAAKADKPRQGWKAATVSRHFWVPSGHLAGAGCSGQAGAHVSTQGARPIFSPMSIEPRTTLSNLQTDEPWDAFYAPHGRFHLDASTLILVLTVLALTIMGWGYFRALKPVTIEIDQHARLVLTNQATVAGVLNDAAIGLHPEDIVFPALDAPIPNNQPISIKLARSIQIDVDGNTLAQRTQSKTIGEALNQAGIFLELNDKVLADGAPVLSTTALTSVDGATIHLVVQRAVPIEVNDNGALTTVYTTAPTLGEALRQAGLVVYLGDAITPDLGTPVTPGWQVYIRRSREASISVDGKTIRTRTLGNTVADLLAQEGIELKDKDYAVPSATNPIREGMKVEVTRVREELITESEYIRYDTVWQADATMDIDQRKTSQVGTEGVKKRTIRLLYENGRETKRSVDREWIDAPPVTQIINYGTKITHRTLTLPNGTTTTYWRKLRILATSYTAATSGKARTHPEFGITATGMLAGTGVVAVDPKVINLKTNLYVPGYGLAIAGDTGGRILGKRVDLGYDESNLVLWFQWVDVYLLDPAPPADQIHWIIPDTPKERVTH